MECNKEEAIRAIEIAERKLSENDYNAAKRLVNKARTLYPDLDGLEQISMMIDVYISASNKNNRVGGGKELDWYGILAVDPLVDEEALKKQYKKLALLLHPDKNRFRGAEGAFKLVLEAWSLLSDKAMRIAYDQKRKSKEVQEKKSEPKPQQHKPASSKQKKASGNFWTMCTHCLTFSEHVRADHLDKTLKCPYCPMKFVATERFPEMVNGKPYIRFPPRQQEQEPSANPQATSKSTSTASSTTSATFTEEARDQALDRFYKGWFPSAGVPPARDNANEAERPLKKPVTTGNPYSRFEDPNSTHEAQRLFKNPMTTGDPNSTHEAQRLFKNPMTTGDPNSTFEAQRLFPRSRWADVK